MYGTNTKTRVHMYAPMEYKYLFIALFSIWHTSMAFIVTYNIYKCSVSSHSPVRRYYQFSSTKKTGIRKVVTSSRFSHSNHIYERSSENKFTMHIFRVLIANTNTGTWDLTVLPSHYIPRATLNAFITLWAEFLFSLPTEVGVLYYQASCHNCFNLTVSLNLWPPRFCFCA
jgi:hypothetical protein